MVGEQANEVRGISRMPVMEAVVKILESEGVEVIFGIPGAGILPFYQALQRSKKIRHILARAVGTSAEGSIV